MTRQKTICIEMVVVVVGSSTLALWQCTTFLNQLLYHGKKILETTEIFDKIEHLKNRGVTYWAESSGPLVDHIISQVNCQSFWNHSKKLLAIL